MSGLPLQRGTSPRSRTDGRSPTARSRTERRVCSASVFASPRCSANAVVLTGTFERRHLHSQTGQHLSHFVVQFARYRFSLFLLRVHQLRRKAPELLFRRSAFVRSAPFVPPGPKCEGCFPPRSPRRERRQGRRCVQYPRGTRAGCLLPPRTASGTAVRQIADGPGDRQNGLAAGRCCSRRK